MEPRFDLLVIKWDANRLYGHFWKVFGCYLCTNLAILMPFWLQLQHLQNYFEATCIIKLLTLCCLKFKITNFMLMIYYWPRLLRYLKNIYLALIFYHARLWIRTPLWNNQNELKLYGKCTYFAQIDYILVLAALTWAVGWKSTTMREISTHTICFPVYKSMPNRCLNPQPSVVKNWSQQDFFLRYL